MSDYPHVPAAFINAIAEEGTKAEAIEQLQQQWNENCVLRGKLAGAEAVCDSYATENQRFHDEIERLRSLHPVRLQARPADGGDWMDIFPAQLGFVTKNGFEVQAIEEKDPSYEAEIQRLHKEKCDALERAYVAEAKLKNSLEQLVNVAHPIDEYHEDMGAVLWWKFPITEPPYVGSPLDVGREVEVTIEASMTTRLGQVGKESSYSFSRMVGGWPGYHTHFTKIVLPDEN